MIPGNPIFPDEIPRVGQTIRISFPTVRNPFALEGTVLTRIRSYDDDDFYLYVFSPDSIVENIHFCNGKWTCKFTKDIQEDIIVEIIDSPDEQKWKMLKKMLADI